MKKFLSLALALMMVFSTLALAACNKDTENTSSTASTGSGETSTGETSGTEEIVVEVFEGNYTYDDYVSTLAAYWNSHDYETAGDAYPMDYLMTGLYTFIYNDDLNKVEGKDPYSGYKIIPEMAASDPVDVTEQIKKDHPEFNIPEDATTGYAYTIDLNPNAKWENGEAINADTYIYSMQQLLNPDLQNYRANDYYVGDICIAGAEEYNLQGTTAPVSIGDLMAQEGYADLDAFLAAYGETNAWINWDYSFGDTYDPATQTWSGESEDKIVEVEMKLNDFVTFYVNAVVEAGFADAETAAGWVFDEIYGGYVYPDNVSYDTVGCFKSGDYQITLVFEKSLSGFYLFYNLTGNWLVYEPYYEACKKSEETAEGTVWTTTYCTSVDTTMSYGPYKLVEYIADSGMKFEKNENWHGYTDGKHIYKDPVDGKYYPMYQTTAINTRVVAESKTAKEMFLKGELAAYGLGAEDFEEYRNSDYAYVSPSETIYFIILNGHKTAIESREEADDFDTTKYDLQTMTLDSFRKAFGVVYHKEQFAATVSPARSGGYALLGESFIYDPETGSRYRDTQEAKETIVEFYGLDVEGDFGGDIDAAIDSITGYDPARAKELFTQAFNEALTAGYITDADNDGKSDQIVQLTYNVSASSTFIDTTVKYMNDKLAEVLVDTPFEGKIEIIQSAPLGSTWSTAAKNGLTDLVLAGWQGSALNPYSLMDVYVNPAYQYNAAWFDSTTIELTIKVPVDGEEKELTADIKSWSDALNGATVKFADGNEYCFGADSADQATRVLILAKLEGVLLTTYDYIPLLQNASMSLLSQKLYYVVEEYNPVMGRGGITYLKYNYTDEEWADYVTSQGGVLKY